MALSGLQIYKLLPQTNCKECNYPTCMAFAMKLAAKQAELAACPYVSEAAKSQLEAAAAPPIRLITISANGRKLAVGNETVLFRHEKTFFHPAGLFVRVRDSQPLDEVRAAAGAVAEYKVDYVGLDLAFDGLCIQSDSGDAGGLQSLCRRSSCREQRCADPHRSRTCGPGGRARRRARCHTAPRRGHGPELAGHGGPGKEVQAAAGRARCLPRRAGRRWPNRCRRLVSRIWSWTQSARAAGPSLAIMTQARRLAIKQSARDLGFPLITFPGEGAVEPDDEAALAAQQLAKYAGFVVLDTFSPATAYALLVLRQNIYTDPQKPIQVQPGLYEINNPKPDSPLMVTTNFSITYFSVANEVDSSGLPGWLLVADAEGMSVLTAWAAGKFDASVIAKSVKSTGIADKISHRRLIIPGQVAVLSGELEEELPGWEIKVGPREAVDLPGYLKLKG